MVGQPGRASEDQFPVIDVVPVDIGIGVGPAGGGFADLPWAADECHLPLGRQMFGQKGVI